jgi:hypothetical protein
VEELTFSPADLPEANRPKAPQNDVQVAKAKAPNAPTVIQFAFP